MIGIVPLRTDGEFKGIPTETLKFILACCLVHVLASLISTISPDSLQEWFDITGFHWFAPFTALSSILVHGIFDHLLFNMLYFFVFAAPIELAEGKRKFWIIVLFAAFFSSYFDALALYFFSLWALPIDADMAMRRQLQLSAPGIGASGMLCAFIAAYLVRFWRNRVYVVVHIFGYPLPKLVRMPAWIVVLVFQVFFNLYYGILWQGILAGGNTGYLAHLGGFIAGFILAFAFGFSKHQKRDYYLRHAEDLAQCPYTCGLAAIKTYQQALAYDPDNGKILLEMARCSHLIGKDDQSREYYRKAVQALMDKKVDEQLIARAYGEAWNRYKLIFVSENQLELVRLLLKYGDWQAAQKSLEHFCGVLGETVTNLQLYIRAKLILAYILDHHAGKQRQAQEIVGSMLGDFPGNPLLKNAAERLNHTSEKIELFNFNPDRPGYPFSNLGGLQENSSLLKISEIKLPWLKARPKFIWELGLGVLLSPLVVIILCWLVEILITTLGGVFGISSFGSMI